MKRSPLKRHTKLKKVRATRRRSSRVENSEYMDRVRKLPCSVTWMMTPDHDNARICYGPVHAHHMREAASAGAGQKPSDSLCVPLCQRHHDEWHAHNGSFKGCSKEWRMDFAIASVLEIRSMLGWEE